MNAHELRESERPLTERLKGTAVDPQVISPGGHLEEKVTVELPDVATGVMRSSGTYIALLLQLEGEKWEQIDVLTDVMELLGITCNDIEERKRFLETED